MLFARVPPSALVAPMVMVRMLPGHLSFGISIGMVSPVSGVKFQVSGVR
jgi:hypothetical protein